MDLVSIENGVGKQVSVFSVLKQFIPNMFDVLFVESMDMDGWIIC